MSSEDRNAAIMLVICGCCLLVGIGVGYSVTESAYTQWLIKNDLAIHDPKTGKIVFTLPKKVEKDKDD